MKNYDLDKIEPVLIRCREYVITMTNFHRMYNTEIPKELRELREDLTNVISKMRGK